MPDESTVQLILDELARHQFGRILASLVRLIRDFDLAEDAIQEAFIEAQKRWTLEGVPDQPRAWIISTARFKAIDAIRRRAVCGKIQPDVLARLNDIQQANLSRAENEIEDDHLRLIFACCHPAIAIEVQIALTLREVCGLTTDQIARAFLISPSTMAQRLVRGKAKIRDAGIPFRVPTDNELDKRIDSVLAVLYLVFNEGYSASEGEQLIRRELIAEAIRLARCVVERFSHSEAIGLLALMILQESRTAARVDSEGDLILLEQQDRTLWDRDLIDEGVRLVEQALALRVLGPYQLQAAIAAVHAQATRASETDWRQIASLYQVLYQIQPTPIVRLNQIVAIAMVEGPAIACSLLEPMLHQAPLDTYYLAHAAQADFYRRMTRFSESRDSYETALSLTRTEPERRFLTRRLQELSELDS